MNYRVFCLSFLGSFIVVFLLFLAGIYLDLFFNAWLFSTVSDWKWYNYFTSHHALTMLWLKGHYLVIAAIDALFSLILAAKIAWYS